MSDSNHQFLVISALGKDHPGIVNDLTIPISQSDCNIHDSRMTVLGGEFAVLMLVEGSEAGICELEQQLPPLGEKLDLTIISRRTEAGDDRPAGLPYRVTVVSLDHPGIVNQLASFFSARNINIEDLDTDSYRAPHTGTPMFAANITVNIPANLSIGRLRDEFLDYCDELNLDAALEPLKG